jgi:hypothetical protein
VAAMLKFGVAIPSLSPFASHLLLVKKRIIPGGFVWITES